MLLESRFNSDATCSFEVILAEDASDDATAAVLSSIGGLVRPCRNPKNLGFLRPCNMAAARAKGEIVVLLNNDALVLHREVALRSPCSASCDI
jgi:GT2 family glycosyltransferase